jgi:hypothetical protein|tara:strand:- start:2596 stop:2748 length:153 start_codon:yes stop_codon:yes gene_type:complete
MDTNDQEEIKLCWIHKIKLIKKEEEYGIPFHGMEKDVYFECPLCKDVLRV